MSWQPEFYVSGTCIVVDRESVRTPHLYIYGPRHEDDDKTQTQRMRLCYEIAEYMNGGERPSWIDDLERRSEDSADDLDGTSIRATGPSVDVNPPNLDWREDVSDEAVLARARLMDIFFGIGAHRND